MFFWRTGLWRRPDFLKLWAGQSVSLFGSQVTLLALPLTAVLTLHASPLQMGLLGAANTASLLLVSLFAGVWVDRLPRKSVMLVSNLGQALLLGSVPIYALLGLLRIEYLYAISFLAGTLTTFFFVAYASYLPSLIEPEELIEGNSKLEASRALAEIGGPALAGLLVQLFSAPLAIVVDALSFLGAAGSLTLVQRREERAHMEEGPQRIWTQIVEGLRLIWRDPVLRPIAFCNASFNCSGTLLFTVFPLYTVRELHLSPLLLGIALAGGSVGGLLGSFLAGPLSRRFGPGRAIVGAACVEGIGDLLIPLAVGPLFVIVALLILARLISGVTELVYHINQISLRQYRTPQALQGRMNASMRFFSGGAIPLAALLAGLLGSVIGLRATLFIGAAGTCLSCLWPLLSPVRRITSLKQEEAPSFP